MGNPIFFFEHFDESTALTLTNKIIDTAKGCNEEIKLIINSPGGYVKDLMAIIDTMDMVQNDVSTIGLGICASCGAVLLSSGTKGKRLIGKNARVLLHQISGGTFGNIGDMRVDMREKERVNDAILNVLSKNTGKDLITLRKDMERDLWLSADEALAYGLVDKIIGEEEEEINMKSYANLEIKENYTQSNSELEYKKIAFEIKEFKEETIDGEDFYRISGYGSIFGNVDLGDDVVEKGAFVESLKEFLPKYLWSHKAGEPPLGKHQIVMEDDKGLFYEALMPKADDFVKNRIAPQVKLGSIDTNSIGFVTTDFVMDKVDGRLVRRIKKAKLFEISLVNIGMNQQASVLSMKNMIENESFDFKTITDVSKLLKTVFTNSQAEKFIYGFKNLLKVTPGNQDKPDPCDEEDLKDILETLNKLKEIENA